MADLTYESVKRQLDSMACRGYRIGIFDRANKTMAIREPLAKEEVLRIVPILKRENAAGKDIFISPCRSEERALVLIDDVAPSRIEEMKRRRVAPACVVETSPENCQAWVSLGPEPMRSGQRKMMARVFAEEFGGDMASADATHFGRLAGFTNRKPKHLAKNGYPLVICRSSPGGHAETSGQIREWALRKESEAAEKARDTAPGSFGIGDGGAKRPPKRPLRDAGEVFSLYFKQWASYTKFHSRPFDISAGDFAVVCRMLKEGYSEDVLIEALMNRSPKIRERKAGHVEDYAIRTVSAAKLRVK
jgi:hypothetical protein